MTLELTIQNRLDVCAAVEVQITLAKAAAAQLYDAHRSSRDAARAKVERLESLRDLFHKSTTVIILHQPD